MPTLNKISSYQLFCWRGQISNNHHELISLQGVSPLKYKQDFFRKKAFHGGQTFWGKFERGYSTLGFNDQIHAKW